MFTEINFKSLSFLKVLRGCDSCCLFQNLQVNDSYVAILQTRSTIDGFDLASSQVSDALLETYWKKWNLKLGIEMREWKNCTTFGLLTEKRPIFSPQVGWKQFFGTPFTKQYFGLVSVEKSRDYIYKQYSWLQLQLCHFIQHFLCMTQKDESPSLMSQTDDILDKKFRLQTLEYLIIDTNKTSGRRLSLINCRCWYNTVFN